MNKYLALVVISVAIWQLTAGMYSICISNSNKLIIINSII